MDPGLFPPVLTIWVQAAARGAERFEFHFGVQPDIQCVEDLNGAFESDAEVLIALIARDLGLMHTEPPREVALRNPLRDAGRDQKLPQTAKIVKIVKFTPFQAFVTLDLLMETRENAKLDPSGCGANSPRD